MSESTAIPVSEFDHEMAITRRVLERVPSEQGEWKPHEKSFPLGHLAQLVARMPGWYVGMLRSPHIDAKEGPPYSFETTDVLLDEFDANVREARRALEDVVGDELDESWSLKFGDQEVFSAPRGRVARDTLRHLVHHRAQLTVYFRLLDIPVPQTYGPSADEPW